MTARSSFLCTTIAAVSFRYGCRYIVRGARATRPRCSMRSRYTGSMRGTYGSGSQGVHQDAFQGLFFALPTCAGKDEGCRQGLSSGRQKNCAGITPGGGRIETCMKDHFADMSDACKAIISQAGGGKS